MKCLPAAIAIGLMAVSAAAQDTPSGGVVTEYPAGWTFTPSFRYSSMLDDNISLFSISNGTSSDYVSTYSPGADVRFTGKQTKFGAGYAGSLLNYRTFSALNQWDQSVRGEFARQETARLTWFANANVSAVPTTDVIDFGIVPYRRTGALLTNLRGGGAYTFGERDEVTAYGREQAIRFDRPDTLREILRGGDIKTVGGTYLHRLTGRFSTGASYEMRHSTALGLPDQLTMHEIQGVVRYRVTSDWTVGGGVGAVHLMSTAISDATTGPAWSALADRRAPYGFLHIDYSRTYLPSLSFGGTVQSQQLTGSFHGPLFGSPRFYTDDAAMYTDSEPITPFGLHLPLRSLRGTALIGWQAQRWVRVEGFYTRVFQTTLVAGAQVDRNIVGFQVVTAKPMRIQ